jgi:hypothetical protein
VARKSRTTPPASRTRVRKPAPPPIPDPFQSISATARSPRSRRLVPTLILRGPWLKALGFPIGASAFLTTDHRGEIVLSRLGTKLPRRLRIVATED